MATPGPQGAPGRLLGASGLSFSKPISTCHREKHEEKLAIQNTTASCCILWPQLPCCLLAGQGCVCRSHKLGTVISSPLPFSLPQEPCLQGFLHSLIWVDFFFYLNSPPSLDGFLMAAPKSSFCSRAGPLNPSIPNSLPGPKHVICGCCSAAKSCPALCDPMDCGMLGFPVLHYLPDLAQVHVHGVGDVIQPSHPVPLLSPSTLVLPSIRVFFNELALCIRWPKYGSFSFNITPSNEYIGFISFRMDWFDLLAVQGTLKGLLQHRMCCLNWWLNE